MLASLAWPGAARGQTACGIEGRGGLWLSAEDVAVADGSPVGQLDSSGPALALAFACDLVDRFALGAGIEADFGETLSQYRTLLIGEVLLTGTDARAADGVAISVRGTAGWAFAADGTGNSILLLPRDTLALDEEASGPAVGASLRAVRGLSDHLSVFLDAGWRASFLELTRFDAGGDPAGEEAETLHVFPVTVGARLRL